MIGGSSLRLLLGFGLSILLAVAAYISTGDSCDSLAYKGHWKDRENHNTWQPPTCTLGVYQSDHIEKCFAGSNLTFIGDSIVRQIFHGLAYKLNSDFQAPRNPHSNQTVSGIKDDLIVNFFWDPLLSFPYTVERIHDWTRQKYQDDVLFVGTGLWYLAALENSLHLDDSFKKAMQALFHFDAGERKAPTGGSPLYFNPLLPSEQSLISVLHDARNVSLLERYETSFNDDIKAILSQDSIKESPPYTVLWAYNEQVIGRKDVYKNDGIHVIEEVADIKADLFLNHYCNSRLLKQGHPLPYGATCCSRNALMTSQLILTALIVMGSFVSFVKTLYAELNRRDSQTPRAFCVVFMTCLTAILYDRTDAFAKLAKLHDQTEFIFLSLLLVILPSLFTIRRIHKSDAQDKFLSYRHTNEWKGWMQVMILLYHWTGVSKVDWCYRFVRLLVSGYLFMTGYGNATSYLTKRNFSAQKLTNQLLRINILTILLCNTMRTPYLDYYFVPLVSVWTIITFLTLACFKRYNDNLFFLVKLIVSCLIVTTMLSTSSTWICLQHISEFIRTSWDLPKAKFRIDLDLYVVYLGVVTAWVQIRTKEVTKHVKLTAIGASIFSVLAYAYTTRSMNKMDYNVLHPLLSPLVVLSFVILRHSCAFLRARTSFLMEHIGEYSLELFVLQFHIFLADDTKHILSLGGSASQVPFAINRYLLVAPSTILFFYISYTVAKHTPSVVRLLLQAVFAEDEKNDDYESSVTKAENLPLWLRDSEQM